MDHMPNIRAIDTHAEGVRRQDKADITAHESILYIASLSSREIAMVTDVLDLLCGELLAECRQCLNQREIDDSASLAELAGDGRDSGEFFVIAPRVFDRQA